MNENGPTTSWLRGLYKRYLTNPEIQIPRQTLESRNKRLQKKRRLHQTDENSFMCNKTDNTTLQVCIHDATIYCAEVQEIPNSAKR